MAEPHAPKPDRSSAVEDLTGRTVGRFVVRARLGAGGMGQVYRAEDTKLKRAVALKRMAPQLRADERFRRRFLAEAERASSLTDQHIAGLYDVLEEGGEIFLVMEYVEGRTLRQRLQEPIGVKECLYVVIQCAEALVTAHEKGIVHQDIKPENIMLTTEGQVKICDFGVARRLPAVDQTSPTESVAGQVGSACGTPPYMAPEVLLEQEPDGRADIFSLGVVFYEALTGRHPFLAQGFVATSDRILHQTPTPVTRLNPRVPAELERILAKMLAKDPAERYATAADLLVDLRALRSGVALPGLTPIPVLPQLWPARRRWGLWAALAVLLALAAVTVPVVRQSLLRRPGTVPEIPAQKNLVVLPFRAIGGGPVDQAYCDGLTETLTVKLTQLTGAHDLQVLPITEVRRRRVSSAEEARKELGANLILEGSVQQAGTAVRVNYALVDPATLRNLRADSITATASDPFAVQDQVVNAVSGWLDLELKPDERRALAARDTQVAGAYDFYLQGRGYLQNYDKPENIESAILVFQRALALDPRYALAHAGLGEAYWRKYENSKQPQWVETARQACEQALTMDAKLAAAHICLGTLHNGTGKYEKAVAEFQRALEIEPTSDDAYRGLASVYQRLGQPQEAEKTYQRAISLRPNYWAGYSWLGAFYYGRTRYVEAAKMFEQVIALAPDNVRGYYNLGGTYIAQGRYADAIPVLQRSVALRPTPTAYNNLASAYFHLRRFAEAALTYGEAVKLNERDYVAWGNLGDAYYWSPGKRTQATGAYRKAVSLAKEELGVNPRDASLLGNLARYHARLEEREPALAYLQRALSLAPGDPELRFKAALVHHQFGEDDQTLAWLEKALAAGLSLTKVRDAPNFDDLRDNPRFQELLRRQASSK